VSPVSAGLFWSSDRRQRILGYRNANHTRPIPKATTPAPASISTALCGPASNPIPCPNQKSPTTINSGPTTTRTIFIRASFDRARPRQRVEKAGAGRGRRFSKKNPPLATGPSQGGNAGNVSRFAAALCVIIHTSGRKRLPRW